MSGTEGDQPAGGVDWAGLLGRVGNDQRAAERVLRAFVRSTTDLLAQAGAASLAGDAGALCALGHQVRGAAGMAGIPGMMDAGLRLERAAGVGDDAGTARALERLGAELARVRAVVDGLGA